MDTYFFVDKLDENGEPTGEKEFIPSTTKNAGEKWYCIFKGQWTDGKMNGPMKITFPDGTCFEGEFDMGSVKSVRNIFVIISQPLTVHSTTMW